VGLIVANFMDSSLRDLEAKGLLDAVPETYNPGRAYQRVIHFTPHVRDAALSEVLQPYGIELVVHQVSGLEPIKIVKTLIQVWRLLGQKKVNIVRGRLPYLGSFIGGVTARLRGLPFVVSLGGDNRIGQERTNTYYLGSRWLSYLIEYLVLKLATRIIVTNQFTSSYVARIIGSKSALSKCVLVPWISTPVSETDVNDCARLQAINLPPDAIVVVVIGFLNRYKFSDVLFDAFDHSLRSEDGRNVLICFAGDGPLRAEGEKRFFNRDDVCFLGWQPKEVIHALLRRADAVLIPMSGFVLLEAASVGKLVIAGNIEWHSEVVRHGETGYLVDPHEPAAWRSALQHAIENIRAGQSMGRNLRAVYWRTLSPQAAIAAEHQLYEELTGKNVSP
jgi:glycosyltransferase involved in cell wall biosynthesis